MRFVCDTLADGGIAVLLALNPVTKTEIKLNPPFIWGTREELDNFSRRFASYCQAAWDFGNMDQREISVPTWPAEDRQSE